MHGHGDMVAWVYGVGFIWDINSRARVQIGRDGTVPKLH